MYEFHILIFGNAYYIWRVKIASTLFLLLAVASMLYMNVGQVGGLYLGINEAKKEASEKITTERLYTLTISEADFASGKATYINEKELRYDGNLYDIASTSTHLGITTIKALHDEKEEGLLSNLKDVVDGWFSAPKNSNQHSLKQIVIIKDFIPVHRFSFNVNSTLVKLSATGYSFPSETPLLAVLKSPPKFV